MQLVPLLLQLVLLLLQLALLLQLVLSLPLQDALLLLLLQPVLLLLQPVSLLQLVLLLPLWLMRSSLQSLLPSSLAGVGPTGASPLLSYLGTACPSASLAICWVAHFGRAAEFGAGPAGAGTWPACRGATAA